MTNPHKQVLRQIIDNPHAGIRELCNRSFFYFFKTFWPTVCHHPLKLNWHIEYLCNELQAKAERVAARLPNDHDLIVNIPPGTTKPVWEEMPVLMADGTYKLLKYIIPGDSVINRYGKPCLVTAVHEQGLQPCVKIKTFNGRNIVVAIDHPVLTADGWIDGGDILPDHLLALMHRPRIISSTIRKLSEFKLAGYFVGDGSVSKGNCSVCGKEMEYIDDFISCAQSLGFGFYKFVDKNGVTVVNLNDKTRIKENNIGKYKGMGRGYRKTSGPRQWLRDIGLFGKNSHTKDIPDFIWHGSDEQICAFLATYFQCDGTISFGHESKRNITVSATTVSKKLAIGLQRLFLRIGISMRLREHIAKGGFVKEKGIENYKYYSIETTDQDSAARFLDKIPLTGSKARKLNGFLPKKKIFEQEYWPDRVRETQDIGQLPCRCLSVDDGESFVIDGVVVHNTMVCSVMFPVWCWTKWHWMRFLTFSYNKEVSLEPADNSKIVLESELFQLVFPDIVLKQDKKGVTNFRVVKILPNGRMKVGGGRLSSSVGGTGTGFHGDFLIIDDPLNPQQAASDKELSTCIEWLDETLPTRKTDKDITPTILIMQRLHQGDPSGHLLDNKKLKIRHICLPGDIQRPGYEKLVRPRALVNNYVDGLLDPVRMSRPTLDDLEERLGQLGWAAQVGQNPTPPKGGMFQVDKFITIQAMPIDSHIIHTVRCWDKAGTEVKTKAQEPAWTVGVKVHRLANGKFLISDVKRGRWSAEVREQIIRSTAEADGPNVEVWHEQEPGSGGKESAEATTRNLAGFSVRADRPIGDKIRRADPWSVQVNAGNVLLLAGDWNRDYIEEHRYFPFSKFKDQVDASSMACAKLAAKRMVKILS